MILLNSLPTKKNNGSYDFMFQNVDFRYHIKKRLIIKMGHIIKIVYQNKSYDKNNFINLLVT